MKRIEDIKKQIEKKIIDKNKTRIIHEILSDKLSIEQYSLVASWDEIRKNISNFDLETVSRRLDIDWKLISDLPDLGWNYAELSMVVREEQIQLVKNLVHKEWDFITITGRKFMNIEFFRFLLENGKKVNFDKLCKREDFTWDLVEKYPDEEWDSFRLSTRKNCPWNIIKIFIEKGKNLHYRRICTRNDIDWKLINDYPEFGWFLDEICDKEYIDWVVIRNIIRERNKQDIEIECDILFRKEDFDLDMILEFPNLHINLEDICIHNKNIEGVIKIIKNDSYYEYLSSNPNLTPEIVEKYKEKPWDFDNIYYAHDQEKIEKEIQELKIELEKEMIKIKMNEVLESIHCSPPTKIGQIYFVGSGYIEYLEDFSKRKNL